MKYTITAQIPNDRIDKFMAYVESDLGVNGLTTQEKDFYTSVTFRTNNLDEADLFENLTDTYS